MSNKKYKNHLQFYNPEITQFDYINVFLCTLFVYFGVFLETK